MEWINRNLYSLVAVAVCLTVCAAFLAMIGASLLGVSLPVKASETINYLIVSLFSFAFGSSVGSRRKDDAQQGGR
ncbi:hypothetical protein [Desulfovibrio inopinatus]|uniref:hypothetical protein n=1 Tax=Desulfovibrio inopinatus TaxID=102109 RepID=UPI00041B696B|nr:hypothetical protein [Desulfovibrio inopinatus]